MPPTDVDSTPVSPQIRLNKCIIIFFYQTPVPIMDNTMMIRTHNNLITCIVVQTFFLNTSCCDLNYKRNKNISVIIITHT